MMMLMMMMVVVVILIVLIMHFIMHVDDDIVSVTECIFFAQKKSAKSNLTQRRECKSQQI